MRRKETQKISDILKEFSKSAKFESRLQETRLIENWGNILGSTIAGSTGQIYIKNRILFVHIESAVMKSELFMIRTQIRDALNKSVGESLIDNIIFR